ncbi:hypothetical protein [Microvirga massiliensis]|uniref:hypothetical protein n=1 Tax=Microvirga massiliensis TaxID=1033741 RepID=UPI00062BA468|nr:hypothetical protein [Microvirga massiliensis]
MLKHLVVAAGLLAALATASSGVRAADLGGVVPAPIPAAYCPAVGHSSIASLPTLGAMQAEVGARYSTAVIESENPRVIFNRAPRLEWAYSARATCGIALGYLSTGEVNVERLRKCECDYARMGDDVVVRALY